MSQLRLQLTEEMKNAMRARDMVKLNTVRFLLSTIKNWEIDHGQPSDQDILKLIAKEIKQMKDAIAEFARGGRQDLVDEESQKVAILEAYLPAQLTATELEAMVRATMAELESTDFGTVMRAVMAKVAGKADGTAVSAVVKQVISG